MGGSLEAMAGSFPATAGTIPAMVVSGAMLAGAVEYAPVATPTCTAVVHVLP
jgi:hypothetical protein